MFKPESYITPIILSYVDKYIKNFRPEDSQVSLWGGDASFHNLDLRLDVLEQELQLPFSLISGHIHELLIHVPWTKLASEPIKITINTIECSLTLRGSENASSEGVNVNKESKRRQSRKQDIAAPPGYVQSLINKIVNNITINCNNLILKYVEEDIVVSINIKLLTFQSANDGWKAAYTDISPTQMIMRKLITLSDLTVCLDKRNAAGKIEIYQEPILYRCFVEMRFLRHFLSNSDKAITTRVDIYCNRMEFSMTEQQIPMLIRIMKLLQALHQRQIKNETNSDINSTHGMDDEEPSAVNESWAGWAWSVASTIFPSEDDTNVEWNYAQRSYSGNIFQIGVCIDNAIFTFKVSEYYSNDKGYYSARKLKYWPLLCLQLNGCFVDTVIGSMEWTSVQMGISEALLLPQGLCSCGVTDNLEDVDVQPYFKIGLYNDNHKAESLFDPGGEIVDSIRKNFLISWDVYLSTVTESVLLEKSPALAVDYLYHLELPDDFTSEQMSELGSDLEFSNLGEQSICRIISGPFTAHICSGLIHRVSTLCEVMKSYDYQPYKELPIEPELSELHPPSEDDFDALNNSIPVRTFQITFLKPVFVFHLMDHPKFIPNKENLFRRIKKTSGIFSISNVSLRCPSITVECETLDTKIIIPIYPKRLIHTTCQLPEPPQKMLNASYQNIDIKIVGLSSQMIFNLQKKTTILLPFNVSCFNKSVIFPKYWIHSETIHDEVIVEIDSITVTSTKAKLMVIYHIIEKCMLLDTGDSQSSVFASTLLQDAARDSGMVVLELYAEQIKWKKIQTICTETHNLKINSIKAFVLEPANIHSNMYEIKEPNQVLIISGPDSSEVQSSLMKNEDHVLFNTEIQFPRNYGKIVHPTLLFYNLKEIKACIDPLLFQWLFYSPKYFNAKGDTFKNQTDSVIYKPRMLSDMNNSLQETPRRTNSRHESIHGSSEREHNIHISSPRPQMSVEDTKESNIVENTYCEFMLKWYKICSNMVIFGVIAECTVYFPTQSLSAVGSQGIEDAILYSLEQEKQLKIMVVNLPHFIVHTAGQRQFFKSSKLPIILPSNVWTFDKFSFPWGIEIKNFCCYTLQNKLKLYFLKPVSGNITIGLSLKYKTSQESTTTDVKTDNTLTRDKKSLKHSKNIHDVNVDNSSTNTNNISSFSVCVYVDNTPVVIALSQVQVHLISSILQAILEVISKFTPKTNTSDKFKFKDDLASNIFRKSHSQSSPTFLKEDILESLSEKTPTSPHVEVKNIEENSIKFTVWMQWTITRFRIKLYGHDSNNLSQAVPLMVPTLKLVFDMEDIMSSLDLQEIYTKFKAKIVTANIHHYKRKSLKDNWGSGIYFGTIMRNREELPSSDKQDDFGFMSITITKAKCGHVHNKWGTSKKHKLAEMKMEQTDENYSQARYITEIIATFQPMDFIISPKTLRNFYIILKPLLEIKSNSNNSSDEPKVMNNMACINNTNLPLAYLDCKGLRIVILCSELIENFENNTCNTCIIEIESINLLPTAENPICRNPIRPDIYQHAAQSRILNIPGSDIEDRQYQLNINSFSVNTGSWKEFSQMLCRESGTSLHTMNENPALEWNNLEWGRLSLIPNLNLLPIINKFNQCIIIAPAITCGSNVLICGCSMEINCISDIEIYVSLQQFHLISTLTSEFIYFLKTTSEETISQPDLFTYLSDNQTDTFKYEEEQCVEQAKDSGVEMIDGNSEIISKVKDSYSQSTIIEAERRSIFRYNSESRSSDFSQCIKCTSLIPSTPHRLNYCPIETLITGGLITISLYKITNKKVIEKKDLYQSQDDDVSVDREDVGYEASEEGSVSEMSTKQKMLPLIFIQISQPNVYVQDVAFEQKTNISFFDIFIKTSECQYSYIDKLPSPKDYKMYLLETKTGICDPITGIPPAFITLKWTKTVRKSPVMEVDFGRPIRLHYSADKLNHLLYIKNLIEETFHETTKKLVSTAQKEPDKKIVDIVKSSVHINDDNYIKYKVLKSMFNDISNFNLKFSQIVLVFKTKSILEMVFSLDKLESYLSFLLRPERIVNTVVFKNITVSTNFDGSSHMLLNPWSCTLKTFAFWESWQQYDSNPQIQFIIDSDCLHLDFGPEQLKCIESVTQECNDLLSSYTTTHPSYIERPVTIPLNTERDQYYKDDLRAGAFQFVDATGNENELPLPYQVMFWNQTLVAMAWRYPQPRILTKVRVFPVPFKLNNDDSEDQQVLCFLEYWSDCLGFYKPYIQFYLSESEVCQLDLPSSVPQSAVASTWRVVLSFSNSKLNSSHYVSPRALAACMRIDSYFNSILIPRIQMSLNLFSFKLSLYNQFNKSLALKMPEKLQSYTPDGLIPDNQCFLILHIENTSMYMATWYTNLSTIDFKTSATCYILDYSTLSMQSFIQPAQLKLTLDLAEFANVSFIAEPITIRFSPAVGHTIAMSAQLWTQNWLTNDNSEPPDMVVITRYVVCNDTNLKLRFGQIGTDEDILLPSRFLHLYSWRSKKYQRNIRIGIEQNGWIWSKPLNIDQVQSEVIEIVSSETYTLLMTVKSLSSTQRQIIFSGQLVVCNMLLDHFEIKVIPFASENKNLDIKNAESYVVSGRSTAPSILIDMNNKMALRLRFLTLESAWSGDVPLEENTRCSQPWLVKIPLQERGQFLSIWCRIVNQKTNTSRKLLVMLWPLFMIRSNLPVITKVQVETPVLNVRLDTMVRGRGELQQLYCPGTIDHSHHLTFEIGTNTPSSNPYVPLNYSLIEHKEIFKKIETENIDEILEFLNKYDESSWPYATNKLINSEWIAEEQPLTHIQVQYQTTCEYSSSLLVDLVPWCLLLNTIGLPVAIMIDGKEICSVRHYGVVTPPKLENTFNIGLKFHKTLCVSPLLQLARADWSQSFYMPRINGVIPLEGNIKVPVKCDSAICMMSVTSSILNELRILQVSSSFIITNHTKLQLQVVCIALQDTNVIYNLPDDINRHSFTLEPNFINSNTGIPLTKWYCTEDISDSDYTLHIIIATDNLISYSCPVRVDKGLFRKNICLYSDSKNIPLIIIAQEYKGLIYLSLHHDMHPQLLIQNRCAEKFFYSQSDANGLPVLENTCINWVNSVNAGTDVYYTMPNVSERFPNIDSSGPEKLILAVKPKSSTNQYEWSQEINISIFNEQYVRIPLYGDIKLSAKKITNTVLITIDSITEVEISAQDIRSRLTEYDTNKFQNKNSNEMIENVSETTISRKNLSFVRTSSNLTFEERVSQDQISTFSDINKQLHGMKSVLKIYSMPNNEKWKVINVSMILKSVIFTLTMDDEDCEFDQRDITTLTCDYVGLILDKNEGINCCVSVADVQCDNKLFHRGCYDFPVVLLGNKSVRLSNIYLNTTSIRNLIEEIRSNCDITINFRMGLWFDLHSQKNITEIQEIQIKFGPMLLYVEDIFVTKVVDYLNDLLPTKLVMWSLHNKIKNKSINLQLVEIPEHLPWEAEILAKPLNLHSLIIEQISLLLSVHSSVKLYIALDRSPLQFSRFERKNIRTTSYQLGHALTMHYLSGAIFGAGWVVGSLELLGSPSGLARTLGTGLRDFISLPYHGLIQGPWAFLVGITHGSASLMRHITAGTLDSVTKLAASVARNLDRLTLDEEHQRRTEESRRQKPQGLTEGLMQGLTGLGISLLGAVGGIAHHTLQSVMNDRASPRSLVTGVGLGLVGVITKPLSGAAELVALTGQGLLQGAGWNPLPVPRLHSISPWQCPLENNILKYKWKLLQNVTLYTNIISATEATFNSKNVILLVTFEALIIINVEDDVIEKLINFSEISSIEKSFSDYTEIRVSLVQPIPNPTQNTEPYDAEMEQVSRARVADYVRTTASLVKLSPLGSGTNNEKSNAVSPVKFPTSQPCLVFFVGPQIRNYLCDILIFVKQQTESNIFKIS